MDAKDIDHIASLIVPACVAAKLNFILVIYDEQGQTAALSNTEEIESALKFVLTHEAHTSYHKVEPPQ
jgi:hypothetical protein